MAAVAVVQVVDLDDGFAVFLSDGDIVFGVRAEEVDAVSDCGHRHTSGGADMGLQLKPYHEPGSGTRRRMILGALQENLELIYNRTQSSFSRAVVTGEARMTKFHVHIQV